MFGLLLSYMRGLFVYCPILLVRFSFCRSFLFLDLVFVELSELECRGFLAFFTLNLYFSHFSVIILAPFLGNPGFSGSFFTLNPLFGPFSVKNFAVFLWIPDYSRSFSTLKPRFGHFGVKKLAILLRYHNDSWTFFTLKPRFWRFSVTINQIPV